MLTPSTHGTRHALVSFLTMVCLPLCLKGAAHTLLAQLLSLQPRQAGVHTTRTHGLPLTPVSLQPRTSPNPRRAVAGPCQLHIIRSRPRSAAKLHRKQRRCSCRPTASSPSLLATRQGCSVSTPQKAAHRGCKTSIPAHSQLLHGSAKPMNLPGSSTASP